MLLLQHSLCYISIFVTKHSPEKKSEQLHIKNVRKNIHLSFVFARVQPPPKKNIEGRK